MSEQCLECLHREVCAGGGIYSFECDDYYPADDTAEDFLREVVALWKKDFQNEWEEYESCTIEDLCFEKFCSELILNNKRCF